MEHTENPPYWFWHQGIVNNNIDSSVNMEAVSRTLSRLVLIKEKTWDFFTEARKIMTMSRTVFKPM